MRLPLFRRATAGPEEIVQVRTATVVDGRKTSCITQFDSDPFFTCCVAVAMLLRCPLLTLRRLFGVLEGRKTREQSSLQGAAASSQGMSFLVQDFIRLFDTSLASYCYHPLTLMEIIMLGTFN